MSTISVKRVNQAEYCGTCNRGLTTRLYVVTLGQFEIIMCIKCLNDLKYKMFEHTRWP